MDNLLMEAEKAHNAKKYKKALALYEKVLISDKENLKALIGLVDCFYNTGDLYNASIISRKIIDISPDIALPYIILSYSENDLTAVEKYAKIALNLGANSAQALCCYGIFLMREEKDLEAIDYFKRAVEVDPHMYLAHYNLSVCYQNTHNIKSQYEQAKILFNLKPNLNNLTNLLGLHLATHRLFHISLFIFPLFYLVNGFSIFFLPHFYLLWLHVSVVLLSIRYKQPDSFKKNIITIIYILFFDILILSNAIFKLVLAKVAF